MLSPVVIAGTTGAGNPRFSPDGSSIAFQDGDRIAIVPVDGGRPQVAVTDSVHPSYSGVAWGPDGSIYYRKTGQGIWRVPAPGREPERVTTPRDEEPGHQWPEVLPNGKGILYTRDLGPPSADSIMLHSLENGEDRALFQGAMARYSGSGHIVYAAGDGTLFAAPFDEDRLEVTGASGTLQESSIYVSETSSGS